MYSGMGKGTYQVDAILNNKKIKPVALANVKPCWSEGIS